MGRSIESMREEEKSSAVRRFGARVTASVAPLSEMRGE
jgi:hypothetical protein